MTLELVSQSYEQRSPASPTNLSAVPYNFDLLIKPYIVLHGTPLLNERNRIVNDLREMAVNIGFYAADDDSETRAELMDRIQKLATKYIACKEPTPMILETMRQETKALGDEVYEYLKSINE